ncbi:MAG TPA: MFS transporter [Thermoanaerobaculia bacterium]|nr:MFS transporter [Thermoanaerobaculia bacterium]
MSAGSHPRVASGLALPLYGGFLLTGVATVLLGPLIPELRERWQTSTPQLALLFVAQFVASSAGSVVSSFHLPRSLVVGYACLALGLAALMWSGWPLALAAMALIGLGLGMAIPATNLTVAHLHPERRGGALNLLNVLWGLGAATSPLLLALFAGRLPTQWKMLVLAALAGSVALAMTLPRNRLAVAAIATPPAGLAVATGGALDLLPFAGMLFLYVGVENAIGGWLVTLGDRVLGTRALASLLIGSAFWAALLGGRAIAPLVLRRLAEPALYGGSLAVAAAGALILAAAGTWPAVAVGAGLAGIGLAPLFPLTVSMLAAATAATRSRTTGWVFGLGGLGGATLPWLAGQGSARGMGLVPIAGLLALAALFAAGRGGVLGRAAAGSG